MGISAKEVLMRFLGTMIVSIFLSSCAHEYLPLEEWKDWDGKIDLVTVVLQDPEDWDGHSAMYNGAGLKGVSSDSTYGHHPSNPIRVKGISRNFSIGETMYLSSLTDTLGRPINYKRLGAAFPFAIKQWLQQWAQPNYGGLIDVYAIETYAGPDTLFIDGYRYSDYLAPKGYAIAVGKKVRLAESIEYNDPIGYYNNDEYMWDLANGIIRCKPDDDVDWEKYCDLFETWLVSDPRIGYIFYPNLLPEKNDLQNPMIRAKYLAHLIEYSNSIYPKRVDWAKLQGVLQDVFEASADSTDKWSDDIPLDSAVLPIDIYGSRFLELSTKEQPPRR